MRLDVTSAAEKYGCSDAVLRRLFKRGGIAGRYESTPNDRGVSRVRLTFDEADLAAAFEGPLSHLAERSEEEAELERILKGMTRSERAKLEARLDVAEAAELYRCSESRVRKSYEAGSLTGRKTPFRDEDGRLRRKLTFDPADLADRFESEMAARSRRAAHVSAIRAAATPLSERQRIALAEVFMEHLREKRTAERHALGGDTALSELGENGVDAPVDVVGTGENDLDVVV